jgi:hypothetical protein
LILLIVTSAAAELKPGDVLGPDNWEQAKGLLPDEFLESYRRGDFRHRVGDFAIDRIGDDPVFHEAVEANRGRYALNDQGSIIDVRTGQPPDYVYAWPFPDIDPNDPQAAMKIVWNFFYTTYYGGNAHYRADLLWVSRRGLDRSIEVDSSVKYYDGQHPRFREPDADRELLTQSLAEVRAPADVNGVLSLSWRYRGADRRDSIWAFVPALRRVRAVSPANRSDGFLGSDMTQDDGAYFDGKVEDFTWKLIGEQDLLVLFDAPSFEQQATLERLAGGGWRMLIPGGRARRLSGARLEGRAVVSGQGGADQAPALGDRGGAEGSLLPLRQAGLPLRQGAVHGQLQLQVRLAGQPDRLLLGDPHQHRQGRARRAVGLGRRRRRAGAQLEARPRHHRRHRRRRERSRRLAHPAVAEPVLAAAPERQGR